MGGKHALGEEAGGLPNLEPRPIDQLTQSGKPDVCLKRFTWGRSADAASFSFS